MGRRAYQWPNSRVVNRRLLVGGLLAIIALIVDRLSRRTMTSMGKSRMDSHPAKPKLTGRPPDQKVLVVTGPSRPLQPREGATRFLRREAVPAALLFFGSAAIVASALANDVTWRAIWIGVASTTVTAGLVDASALLAARKRERSVLRIAGDRVGVARAIFRELLDAMFGGLFEMGWPSSHDLRQVQEPVSIDLDEDAGVMPPRSRRIQIIHLTGLLTDALGEALRLGADTSEAFRFEEIDSGMRRNDFVLYLHSVIGQGFQFDPLPPKFIHSAADALDLLEKHLAFFRRIAGASWQYGPAAD